MTRRLTSIFLILLLTINSIGLLFFYWSQLVACKVQAAKYIEENKTLLPQSLTVFSSLQQDFELVNNKEIEYNGYMYDIVKTQIAEGNIIYYAISDGKEDLLIQDVAALAKNNANGGTSPDKKATFEILKFINNWNNNAVLLTCVENTGNKNFLHTLAFYASPHLGVLSPPPRFISGSV